MAHIEKLPVNPDEALLPCGLRELAIEAGYKGSNLSALESSSNFKHMHIFLLDAYESVYLHALELYLATKHAQVATHDGFSHYLMELVGTQPAPVLWFNLLNDLETYVMFWLSLRCADWTVCMGTFKQMAKLFHAFDRQNYIELSAVHLADVWQMPKAILDHFNKGAFTTSIRGISTHNQA